ncbi:MAG: hypothetical protein KQJ78_04520 [Deltaproteobacteria bacterium]|nr:hypothetical protein [Deltaproteobacteria bacterium]
MCEQKKSYERETRKEFIKMLIEKHWDHAQLISKERMWVVVVYGAAFGWLIKTNGVFLPKTGENVAGFFLLFVLGVLSVLLLIKLNFLYEYHLHRSQYYLTGFEDSKVLTNFGESGTKYFSVSFVLPLTLCFGSIVGLMGAIVDLPWLFIKLLWFACKIPEHYAAILNVILLLFGVIVGGVLGVFGGVIIWRKNGKNLEKARKLAEKNTWHEHPFPKHL